MPHDPMQGQGHGGPKVAKMVNYWISSVSQVPQSVSYNQGFCGWLIGPSAASVCMAVQVLPFTGIWNWTVTTTTECRDSWVWTSSALVNSSSNHLKCSGLTVGRGLMMWWSASRWCSSSWLENIVLHNSSIDVSMLCRASYVTPTSIFNSIRAVHPMFRGYLQHVSVVAAAAVFACLKASDDPRSWGVPEE